VVEGAGGSRVGSWFGRYELGRLLGRGGFGEVYEARDSVMGRQVALKLLAGAYSGDPVFRERLFREAHAAGRLREPHIVPIHGCGEIDGQLFIDMRLIEGKDLDAVLGACVRLEPARAVAIVSQIAAALDAAHAEGMVHRDIKPGNILITDTDFAYLVDFGLANAATDPKLTSTGMTIGTFAYLAPERLTNTGIGGGVDIYALACVLFKCLTGQTPYRGDIPALISAHLSAPIPRPSEYDPTLPAGLDAVIATGMAKSAHQRYPSATELAAAAYHALNSAEQHQADTIAHPTTAAPSRPTSPWSTPPTPADHPTMHRPTPPSARAPKSRNLPITAIATVVTVIATIAVIAVAVTHHLTQTASSPPTPAPDQSPSTTTTSTRWTEAMPSGATQQLPFGNLLSPWAVAVDGAGTVYVSDRGSGEKTARVLKLTAGAASPTVLPFGELTETMAVAVDSIGSVFATDNHPARVMKLPPDATAPTALPLTDLNENRQALVAVDGAGNLYTFNETGGLLKLGAGETTPATLPVEALKDPISIAAGADGTVYAGERSNRVVKLIPGGRSWTPVGDVSYPQSLAVDPAGNLFILTDTGGILKLAAGAASPTQLNYDHITSVIGIAVDAADNIYTTDEYDKRVLKLPAR
jgi:serine/threonine protein kinase, bacterial